MPPRNPMILILDTLRKALADKSTTVRIQAALSVGKIGAPARERMPELIGLLHDADETARCQAAESLGKLEADPKIIVPALTAMLQDASSAVKVSVARALGSLKKAAADAVPSWCSCKTARNRFYGGGRSHFAGRPSRQGHRESSKALPVNNLVRPGGRAMGTIGTTAQDAAPALVGHGHRQRACVPRRSKRLGKIGRPRGCGRSQPGSCFMATIAG